MASPAERQIEHRKSSLVLSARFPIVKWRSRFVAKSGFYQEGDGNRNGKKRDPGNEAAPVHGVAFLQYWVTAQIWAAQELRSRSADFFFAWLNEALGYLKMTVSYFEVGI